MVKNVIIVSDFGYVNGGAAKVAIASARELARRGLRVVFFSAVGPVTKELADTGVKVVCLNQFDILKNPNRLQAVEQGIWNSTAEKQFNKLLSEFSPADTVIHFHGITKALSASILKVTASKDFQVLWTMHEYFAFCPNGGMFNYKSLKICDKKAMSLDCITCNCDARNYPQKIWRVLRQRKVDKWLRRNKNLSFITISLLNKKVAESYLSSIARNWYFLQNPISLTTKPQVADIANNSKYLFIGRLAKEKGLNLFCQALTDLKLQGIVLGDGYLMDEYKSRYPNIVFAGWVSGEKKDNLIMQGKALLFPSLWYEGAPLTILEMKSYGMPCIVPDRCAAAEEVEDGKTGFVFKTGNLDSLKEAILKYESCNKKTMQQNILNSYNPNRYSIETHVNNLIDIYNRVLKSK